MQPPAAWLLLAAACAGCGAVPDLTFVEADGGAPAVTTTDGGADDPPPIKPGDAGDGDATIPPHDGGDAHVDSGGGKSGVDAAPPGCPSDVPMGATSCCGDVPCVGAQCQAKCAECAACSGSYCCVPNGIGRPISCVATATACQGGGIGPP